MLPDIVIPTNKTSRALKRQIADIKRTAPGCRVLPTCFNASASVNRNWGLNHAGPLVIMVDDDITGFFDGWATKLVEPLADSRVIMVSARLMTPRGKPGVMMNIAPDFSAELVATSERVLPTACLAFRNEPGVRFDEMFLGAGFEDSVTGDMPVIVRRNGCVEVIPIEDLYGDTQDGHTWPFGCEIWARSGWRNVLGCYRHTVNKPIYRVRTKAGLLCVTGDHSLFLGGVPARVGGLCVGDKIDLATLPDTTDAWLSSEHPWEDGLFSAEGTAGLYHNANGYHVANAKIDMEDEAAVDRAVASLGWRKYEYINGKTGSKYYRASLIGGDRVVRVERLCERYYSPIGRHKIVPVCVLSGSASCQQEYLDGFHCGDGHIEQRKPTYTPQRSCSTKSFALALGIQMLWTRAGKVLTVNVRHDKMAINLRINTGGLGSNQAGRADVKPAEDTGAIRGIDDVTRFYADSAGNVSVYDVTTEDGTFVAGLGGVVAHNTDYSMQLNQKHKRGRWLVHNGVQLVHKNEMKGQRDWRFNHNRDYYLNKWRHVLNPK